MYTKEEIEKILLRFQNNITFTCVFLTACYTGMRTGEVFALTWDDIDLDNRIIKINKTVYAKDKEKNGRWYLGTPKTNESCREGYICDTVYKALYNYKKQQQLFKKKYGNEYRKYSLESIKNKYGKIVEYKIIDVKRKNKNSIDMVFVRKDGTYVGTDVIKYPFKIIHNELSIKNCRFYDLRGSYATKSLRSGVEIKDVADILGHSRIETTENYYIYSSDESRKYVSEIFERNMQISIIDQIMKKVEITKKLKLLEKLGK